MLQAIIYYGGFVHRAGGAFGHAQDLKAALERRGWAVRLVTLDDLPVIVRYLPHLAERTVNRIRRPSGYLIKGWLTKVLYKAWFSSPADLLVFEDIYLSWNASHPSITVLHAVWSDNLQAFSVPLKRVEVLKQKELELLNEIDHPVVTVSEPYKKFLITRHYEAPFLKKLAVIELGVEPMAPPKGEIKREEKSSLYCGALEKRKNVMFLLQAFKHAHQIDPEQRLSIIGNGPDERRLKDYANHHGLPVTFLGRYPRSDVVSEMRRHSLYVHPSVKESFSYALLEAKFAGLPTMAEASLQVPREFIDIPLNDFDPVVWGEAIAAPRPPPPPFDAARFTIDRMADQTLARATTPEERNP